MTPKPSIDPDIPVDPRGKVYHIEATAADIADKIILVGDPGRVPQVAEFFDPGTIEFNHMHREIRTITGRYKGIRITAMSSGMGTDNMEIILNELHILKEYNPQTNQWGKPAPLTLIRVGTCGSPQNIDMGTLAITGLGIGLDNTCQYYLSKNDPEIAALEKIANQTPLGQAGIYATRAHPAVIEALMHSVKQNAPNRPYVTGITASASGFYACQGRGVGRLKSQMRFPNLIEILAGLQVVNLEMENSSLCYLANLLGYKAGTICAVISTRGKDRRDFASPEQSKAALHDALVTALEAIITL